MASIAIADIPGSKSLTNRALLTAAAAPGTTVLRRPLVSDDTVAFAAGLRALGYDVDTADDMRWAIRGTGEGPRQTRAEVDCVDAGTAARFLPVLAACGHGTIRFTGSEQLRRRPLRPLTTALHALGARLTSQAAEGQSLPFVVHADGISGGDVEVDGRLSSQYLSGLLLSAPLMRAPLRVRVPVLVSHPYIEMTTRLMARFGVTVNAGENGVFEVSAGRYRAIELDIEPDASTASYFFAAAALTGQTITVPGLGADSLQGDIAFVDVLRQLGAKVDVGPAGTTVSGTGALRGDIDVNMGPISDTFMTLACIAPFADGPVRIHGIAHARLKESDRIDAVAHNLRSCGVIVQDGPDWIEIRPSRPHGALIGCRRDHRIAMSFSVLGLRADGVRLDDPACVSKTFPNFHSEFSRLFGVTAPA